MSRILLKWLHLMASLVAQLPGSIPGLGRSLGEGNDNPHQYPCLENLMDTGAWWAAVHGFAESGTTD